MQRVWGGPLAGWTSYCPPHAHLWTVTGDAWRSLRLPSHILTSCVIWIRGCILLLKLTSEPFINMSFFLFPFLSHSFLVETFLSWPVTLILLRLSPLTDILLCLSFSFLLSLSASVCPFVSGAVESLETAWREGGLITCSHLSSKNNKCVCN